MRTVIGKKATFSAEETAGDRIATELQKEMPR